MHFILFDMFFLVFLAVEFTGKLCGSVVLVKFTSCGYLKVHKTFYVGSNWPKVEFDDWWVIKLTAIRGNQTGYEKCQFGTLWPKVKRQWKWLQLFQDTRIYRYIDIHIYIYRDTYIYIYISLGLIGSLAHWLTFVTENDVGQKGQPVPWNIDAQENSPIYLLLN